MNCRTHEGRNRNFNVHQTCTLFVEGAQQVLKWQIVSCATWINIDSGPDSLMTAQAGVLSKYPWLEKKKRVTEGQGMSW